MTAEYNADASLVPKCPRNRQQEGNKAEKYSTESEKAFQKRQVMLSKYSSSSIQLATKKEKEKNQTKQTNKNQETRGYHRGCWGQRMLLFQHKFVFTKIYPETYGRQGTVQKAGSKGHRSQ